MKFKLDLKQVIINIILFFILLFISKNMMLSCFFNETLVQVPSVVNMDKEKAKSILKKSKLNANIISSRSVDVPIDYVYAQSPKAGEMVKKNRGIKIYINDDNGEKIPDLVGKTLVEAMAILESKNIRIRRVDYIYSENANNNVIASYPKENTRYTMGMGVSLLVSTKDIFNSSKMPNIIGLDVNEANSVLAQIGYKIDKITKISNTTFPINTIITSEPMADMPLNKDTKINVVISEANERVEKEKIKQESIDEIIRQALTETENGDE